MALKEYIEKEFADNDVFISFGSRTIIKKLSQKGIEVKDLSLTLADVDMLGYKKIVVSSVNLFAAEQHELAQKSVESFCSSSASEIRLTQPIFATREESAWFIRSLHEKIKREDVSNLFVFHGSRRKNVVLEYLREFIKGLEGKNFSCTLKEFLPSDDLKESMKKIQILPMLLVSGNHYDNEIAEIRKSLESDFEPYIAKSPSGRFCLLELKDIKEMIKRAIEKELAG